MGRQTPQQGGHAGMIIAILALVIAFVAALGGVLAGPQLVDAVGATSSTQRTRWVAGSTPAEPPPVLASMDGQAPVPSAASVATLLTPLLTVPALGPHFSASVIDVTTGQVLLSHDSDAMMTPASTTKLVTAATVLAARGPAYRIPTRVVAGANPGEVVIIGGGDPTLASFPTGYYPGAARLDDLAAQVRKALGATPPTKVIYDGSLFTGATVGPAWDADDITQGSGANITALMSEGARTQPLHNSARFAQPDVAAAQAFAKLLGLPVTAIAPGAAPAGAAELGKVESAPLLRLVEFMLQESDNVLADSLARQVALVKGQPASFEGGAVAMKAQLQDLTLPVTGFGLVDGSGFSRQDRLSPAFLTGLIAAAARSDRGDLHGVFSGLPVAGYSGTLINRYLTPQNGSNAAGMVRAKTGTLTGVNSLVGMVVDVDGRSLAFAFMADQTTGNQAIAALDRVAAMLATCGCH